MLLVADGLNVFDWKTDKYWENLDPDGADDEVFDIAQLLTHVDNNTTNIQLLSVYNPLIKFDTTMVGNHFISHDESEHWPFK